MDRRVLDDILPLLRENRFAFDIELLVLARRLGYTQIVEAPVHIQERLGSTISLKSAWRLLADTFGISVRLSILHDYDSYHVPGWGDCLGTERDLGRGLRDCREAVEPIPA